MFETRSSILFQPSSHEALAVEFAKAINGLFQQICSFRAQRRRVLVHIPPLFVSVLNFCLLTLVGVKTLTQLQIFSHEVARNEEFTSPPGCDDTICLVYPLFITGKLIHMSGTVRVP